jgi:ankyrin repeat protein
MKFLPTFIVSSLMWIILSNQSEQIGGESKNESLFIAIINGNLEIVKELIKEGADVNEDNNSITPIMIASSKGYLDIVKELIKAGADVNKENDDEATPIFFASNGHLEIVKELIKAGADVNYQMNDGTTPIMFASKNGHLEIVKELIKELIKAGADVNKENDNEITPIFLASKNGHLEIVKELMKTGADVNKENDNGETPIMTASHMGHLKIVKELIKEGADVNKENTRGDTPLFDASAKGHLEIVKELIKEGADVNKEDKKGNTPIRFAIINGNLETVKELIKAGADVKESYIKEGKGQVKKFLKSNIKKDKLPNNPTKKCHEDINIISQEKWEDEDLNDLIYIKWSSNRTDCYKMEELDDYIDSIDKMIEWKGDKNNNTGHGWRPDPKKATKEYVSLYPIRNWVLVSSLDKILTSNKRHFKAVKIRRGRLGNKNGTFGVSQKHAQEEEDLWEIKFDKKEKEKKPCPQGKVRNPKTNRCVKEKI